MDTERKPLSGAPSAGWECKPYGPGTETLVLIAFIVGLVCGLVPLFLATGGAHWVERHFGVVCILLLLLVLISARLLWYVRTGHSYLRMDDEQILWLCQSGRSCMAMWNVRLADIESITFRGGSFVTGRFSVTIRGRDFFVRESDDGWDWAREGIVGSLIIGEQTLRLHPHLLERLIQLAEGKKTSDKQDRALERAKRFAEKAARETPTAIPVGDVQALHASLDALAGKVQKSYRTRQMLAITLCFLALVGLGILVFFHLRGNFLVSLFMPPAAFCLLFISNRVWPITQRFTSQYTRFALLVLLNAAIVLAGIYMWYYPLLWFAVAAYLVLLVYDAASLRFGRRRGRWIWGTGGFLVAAYTVAATIYFTNWQTAHLEKVFSIRYQWTTTLGLTLSPDGKTLAFALMHSNQSRAAVKPEFVPRRDSLIEALGRLLAALRKSSPPGDLPPWSPMSRIVFASTDGATATDLILPVSLVSVGPWSPDSQRVALDAFATSATDRLWIAEPAKKLIRRIPGTSFTLAFPYDAWSSDGLTLKTIKTDRGPTTRTQVVIHVESGRVEFHPFPSDGGTTPLLTWQEMLSPLVSRKISPNGAWNADSETSAGEGRVAITSRKSEEAIATIVVPNCETNPRLFWSPDSRKLAIPGGCRIRVYDTQTGRTVMVKAWRQPPHYPAIVWSPDSRSFYFNRSIACTYVGLEIVRATLRE